MKWFFYEVKEPKTHIYSVNMGLNDCPFQVF